MIPGLWFSWTTEIIQNKKKTIFKKITHLRFFMSCPCLPQKFFSRFDYMSFQWDLDFNAFISKLIAFFLSGNLLGFKRCNALSYFKEKTNAQIKSYGYSNKKGLWRGNSFNFISKCIIMKGWEFNLHGHTSKKIVSQLMKCRNGLIFLLVGHYQTQNKRILHLVLQRAWCIQLQVILINYMSWRYSFSLFWVLEFHLQQDIQL